MPIQKMIERFNQWALPFFKTNQTISPYHCCIYLTEQEILFAYAERKAKQYHLLGCDSIKYQKDNLSLYLTNLVKQHGMKDATCSWILNPADYQMMLLDALPVPKEELRDALYWKIKPLITFPIEEAVYDAFLLPTPKIPNVSALMTVVISNVVNLTPIVNAIKKSGLHLKEITIPELVLKNVSSWNENKKQSATLIYFLGNRCYHVITHEKTLYVHRELHISNVENDWDKLIVEIQRTYEYFQNYFRLPFATDVYISSFETPLDPIVDYLAKKMTIPIKKVVIPKNLSNHPALTINDQGKCLMVLGAILHTEAEDVSYAAAD